MERRENEARRKTGGNDPQQNRQPLDGTLAYGISVVRPQDPPAKRSGASWLNWQAALYVFVLGWMCVFLVPLTSFWWIVPVLGAAVPISLALLDRAGPRRPGSGAEKLKERELLRTLNGRSGITPATAALHTPLTIDEASKMLDELARKGHIRLRAVGGTTVYAPHERDQHEPPAGGFPPPEPEPASDGVAPRRGVSQRLEDPLSERELEVLALLASGRTNSEVARDLFVSVGTVKSHTGNIYRKLQARNRAEAVARARDFQLLA